MMAIQTEEPEGYESTMMAQLPFTVPSGETLTLELWGVCGGDGHLDITLVGDLSGLDRGELAYLVRSRVRPVMQAVIAGMNEVLRDAAKRGVGMTMHQMATVASIAADEALKADE